MPEFVVRNIPQSLGFIMDNIIWRFQNNYMTAYDQDGKPLRSWHSCESFGRFFVALANQHPRLSRELLWPLVKDDE